MCQLKKFLLALFLFISTLSPIAFAESKKVVIFYSSIGMGHLSAARAIEQNIKIKDPDTIVELKNIRDFMPKWKNYTDEKLFWLVVKNSPNYFDKLFKGKMKSSMLDHNYFDNISNSYSEQDVLKYLEEVKPTHIIATHYGSAETMIKLRSQGSLRDTPVAWLHTDYFKGYFPRISQNIEKTFLGMPELEKQWKETGLDPEKVTTTGLPVNPKVFEPVDKDSFLREQGLNPEIKTIVIASGGEGVGDFPTIVKSISSKIKEPVQIVAICAKNEEHVKNLTNLKPKLPPNVNLVIHGFVKNDLLLNLVKSSDLYITKSGGLSPTEGFAINKPIVLLDVYGGHERENAQLFEKLGLAIVNKEQKNIGSDVYKLLNDEALQEKMLEQQGKFRDSFNINAITDFVFSDENRPNILPAGYGTENNPGVKGAQESLKALDDSFKSDIEIILSYGKSDTGKIFIGDTNPFGHIAIKVDDTVYTLNGRAKKDVEKTFVFRTELAEYLYGTQRPVENMEHSDAFGSSYARNNISIRISGVSSSQKKAMLDYFEQVDTLFREGKIGYDKKHFNCADLVKTSLIKAGFNIPPSQKEKGPSFPLDVLTNVKNYFESSSKYKSEIVLYSKASSSENAFKQNTFPISPNQFQRTVKTLASNNYVDEFEKSVGKRIAIGSSDPKTYFENLNGVSELETQKEVERQEKFLASSMISFEQYETQLDQLDKYSTEFKFKSDDIANDLKIISKEYTVEELNHVIKNEISEKTFPDADKRKRAEALFVGFKKWEELQKRYQENMDSFIKTEMNYLIVGTYTTLTVLWDDLVLKYPKIPRKELNQLLSKAQLNYKFYQQSVEQYGKPLDGPTRTTAYRAFFDNAKEFIDLYQSTTQTQVLAKEQIKKIDSKAKRLYSVLKGIVLMTPEVVKVLFKTFLPSRHKDSSVALSKNIDSLFLKFAKAFRISAKLENQETLDKLIKEATPGSKKINIITPNHSHPIHDAILMSSLNLPNYLLVMATDQILAGSLADKVDKNDHIITVGRGSDTPIEKILAQLNKGQVNNIVIYPEGSVSVGIYETRPLREKFSHGLINELTKAGYEINIVPVAYKDSARFLHKNSISSFFKDVINRPSGLSYSLSARIKDPIPPEIVKAIMASGQYDLLNLYIRQNWLDDLGKTSKTLSGLLKSKDLITNFEKEFKINIRSIRQNTNRCMTFYR